MGNLYLFLTFIAFISAGICAACRDTAGVIYFLALPFLGPLAGIISGLFGR